MIRAGGGGQVEQRHAVGKTEKAGAVERAKAAEEQAKVVGDTGCGAGEALGRRVEAYRLSEAFAPYYAEAAARLPRGHGTVAGDHEGGRRQYERASRIGRGPRSVEASDDLSRHRTAGGQPGRNSRRPRRDHRHGAPHGRGREPGPATPARPPRPMRKSRRAVVRDAVAAMSEIEASAQRRSARSSGVIERDRLPDQPSGPGTRRGRSRQKCRCRAAASASWAPRKSARWPSARRKPPRRSRP